MTIEETLNGQNPYDFFANQFPLQPFEGTPICQTSPADPKCSRIFQSILQELMQAKPMADHRGAAYPVEINGGEILALTHTYKPEDDNPTYVRRGDHFHPKVLEDGTTDETKVGKREFFYYYHPKNEPAYVLASTTDKTIRVAITLNSGFCITFNDTFADRPIIHSFNVPPGGILYSANSTTWSKNDSVGRTGRDDPSVELLYDLSNVASLTNSFSTLLSNPFTLV